MYCTYTDLKLVILKCIMNINFFFNAIINLKKQDSVASLLYDPSVR
jgi:hypothetical protein